MFALTVDKNLSQRIRRTFLITTFAGLALSLALTGSFTQKSPIHTGSAPLIATASSHDRSEKVKPALPVRLKIPKIGVDAALEHVGLTAQKEMDAPKDPANAAWFDQGPRPGEKGSSVIDGHSGYKNHIPAVFDSLHALQKGDKLYIEDEKGRTITFVVRELQTYGPEMDGSTVFQSSDGRAHLNFITCQGDWNKTQKSYTSRLVVFADEETQPLPKIRKKAP